MENGLRNSYLQGDDLKRNRKKYKRNRHDSTNSSLEATHVSRDGGRCDSRPWSFVDMVKGNNKQDEGR